MTSVKLGGFFREVALNLSCNSFNNQAFLAKGIARGAGLLIYDNTLKGYGFTDYIELS